MFSAVVSSSRNEVWLLCFFLSLNLFLQSGEAVKELHNQLTEKLELRKPSPAEVTETPSMELPLPTVPTPASRWAVFVLQEWDSKTSLVLSSLEALYCLDKCLCPQGGNKEKIATEKALSGNTAVYPTVSCWLENSVCSALQRFTFLKGSWVSVFL